MIQEVVDITYYLHEDVYRKSKPILSFLNIITYSAKFRVAWMTGPYSDAKKGVAKVLLNTVSQKYLRKIITRNSWIIAEATFPQKSQTSLTIIIFSS